MTIAGYVWRKQNLKTYRKAEAAKKWHDELLTTEIRRNTPPPEIVTRLRRRNTAYPESTLGFGCRRRCCGSEGSIQGSH
jgi:hypothetical protein